MASESAVKQKPIVTTYQNLQDWLDARKKGVGSSDPAVILGLNPYKSELQLYCEKTGIMEPPDLSDNEAVEWGRELEPIVANKYAFKTQRDLIDPGRMTIQQHWQYEWMLATLDRIIKAIDDRGDGILEIKTTGTQYESDWSEDAPVLPQVQLQHQFAVTGLKWGSLAVLIGGQKFRYKDFDRNENFISFLIEREEEFWDRVKTGRPPSPDSSISAREALRRLYPKDEGTIIELPEEAVVWAQRREAAKKLFQSAETEIREMENLLKAAIGPNTSGLLPGGGGFSYKLQRRAAFQVEATEFRVLREIKGIKHE